MMIAKLTRVTHGLPWSKKAHRWYRWHVRSKIIITDLSTGDTYTQRAWRRTLRHLLRLSLTKLKEWI
jgi:hypothetical protein